MNAWESISSSLERKWASRCSSLDAHIQEEKQLQCVTQDRIATDAR